MKKIILLLLGLTISLNGYTQENDSYEIKWKIPNNDFLSYKTYMEELDNSQIESNDKLSALLGDLGLAKDTTGLKDKLLMLFESLRKEEKNYHMISVLNKKKNRIKVSMIRKQINKKKQSSEKDSLEFYSNKMNEMRKGIQFRGELNENGSIYSYYLLRKQKTMLAIFFQLPEKPVSIGDSWSIDMQWFGTNFSFDCDSANHHNKVTLSNIKILNKDTIATIKYDLHEYLLGNIHNVWNNEVKKSEMIMDFNGICEFNLSKGKWKTYNAVMTLNFTGFQNIKQKFRYSLIETSLSENDKELIRKE